MHPYIHPYMLRVGRIHHGLGDGVCDGGTEANSAHEDLHAALDNVRRALLVRAGQPDSNHVIHNDT
jgi:hypothetical protein